MDQEDGEETGEMLMFDDENDQPVKKESKIKKEGFENDDFVGFEDGTQGSKNGLKSDESTSF